MGFKYLVSNLFYFEKVVLKTFWNFRGYLSLVHRCIKRNIERFIIWSDVIIVGTEFGLTKYCKTIRDLKYQTNGVQENSKQNQISGFLIKKVNVLIIFFSIETEHLLLFMSIMSRKGHCIVANNR